LTEETGRVKVVNMVEIPVRFSPERQ
jgi:hypothetical protein